MKLFFGLASPFGAMLNQKKRECKARPRFLERGHAQNKVLLRIEFDSFKIPLLKKFQIKTINTKNNFYICTQI